MFTTVYQNTDAVISGKSAISSSNNGNAPTTPSLPASLLTKVRALPSVGRASGGISDSAQLVGRNGKVISSGGAPGLAFSYSPAGQHFNPLTLTSGRFPTSPGEVAIDASTASKHNYKVGEEIGVVARGPVERFRIVGTVKIGGVSSLGRRHDLDLHAGRGPATLQQGRSVRPDQRRREARATRPSRS